MANPSGFCLPLTLLEIMDSSDRLDELQREAEGIVKRATELLSQWANVQTSMEELSSLRLAHYTSLEAIVDMLQKENSGLRLSDTSTMNDPEEGRATEEARLISHLLKEEFGKESWLWQRYSEANVCCFVGIAGNSEQVIDAGNDLLFWRLYGNDCRGVSITIPPHVSKPLVEASTVCRVRYTDESTPQINVLWVSSLLKQLNKLHERAREATLWLEICPGVLSACDLLLKQRFLSKRSHYEMEREYRAVEFLSEDDPIEPIDSGRRGQHVQYGRVRRYVEIPWLGCKSILTTGSQVTVGSNVPEHDNAREVLVELVPSGVSVRVSGILYRPRR